MELCPPGGRRKGRPRNSLVQEVTPRMREKGILRAWNGSRRKHVEKKEDVKTDIR